MCVKICVCLFVVLGTLTNSTECSRDLSSLMVPINYKVTIKLNSDAFFSDQFYGEVLISFDALEEITELKFNAKNLTFTNISMSDGNIALPVRQPHFDNEYDHDVFTARPTASLPIGTYVVNVTFKGTFNTYDRQGLYKLSYDNEYLIATQTYPDYASRIFPCFEKPSIKTTFDLTVIYPQEYKVIANTVESGTTENLSNNTSLTRFKRTPLMSTFSLDFIISKLRCESTDPDIVYRVCSRAKFRNETHYVLHAGYKLLEYIETYTQIPYSTGTIAKLDVIAVPVPSKANVQTWGIIVANENNLLWNPKLSTTKDKRAITVSFGKQIAQIWLGNLVTMNAFLCEAIATYLGYLAASEFEATWYLDKQFVLEELHDALFEDSFYGLTSPLNDQIEVQSSKGVSIIRMIVHTLGIDSFQKGIQYFFKKYSFNDTKDEDFWYCIRKFSGDLYYSFDDFIANYIYTTGYPVINATRDSAAIILTQDPFYILPPQNTKTHKKQWHVPISYTTSRDKEYGTIPQIWLNFYDDNVKIERAIQNSDDWIILNNFQTGYYRVLYDDDLQNRISSALAKDINAINAINRAQIIDDLFNLARGGYIGYDKVLNHITFLQNDTEYYPWYVAFKGFSDILLRIKDPEVKIMMRNYISNLTVELYNTIDFTKNRTDNEIYIMEEVMIYSWACKLENPKCINSSVQTFAHYRNGFGIDSNFKFDIICTALKHSDYVESDWEFLWELFKITEEVAILEALGCAPKASILKKYLQILCESDNEQGKMHIHKVLSSIIKNNPGGLNIVLQYLTLNYDTIYNYYRVLGTIKSLILMIANVINEPYQVVLFTDLTKVESMTYEVQEFTKNALNLAIKNLNLKQNIETQVAEYFLSKVKNETENVTTTITENVTTDTPTTSTSYSTTTSNSYITTISTSTSSTSSSSTSTVSTTTMHESTAYLLIEETTKSSSYRCSYNYINFSLSLCTYLVFSYL